MRRLLVSLALAVVVGGTVLGAAASLSITAPPLSAGSTLVASCDQDATDLLWDVQWNGSQHQVVGIWYGNLDDACSGRPVDVVLTQGGVAITAGTSTAWTNWGVDNNSIYVPFVPAAAAAAVDDIHVVIR
jgi:hypothetical protein